VCIEQSSGSGHAAVDRCESFTDTSLNRTEAVAVPGSSDEPDSQPLGSDECASQPSPEVSCLRRSSRVPKPIRRWPDNEWTTYFNCQICSAY